MEGSTPLTKLNAHIHKKLSLDQKTSLFLTLNSKLINYTQNVADIAEKGRQQDGIIYLDYADQEPFGFGNKVNWLN